MTDARATPALRYRRVGGGYRRDDVEAALEQLLSNMRTVKSDLEQLRGRSTDLERELRAARAELQAYRAREEQLEATVRRAEELLAQTKAE